jgi:hypothetical protein
VLLVRHTCLFGCEMAADDEWDPLADTKLVLFDAAVEQEGASLTLTLTALRIRRWGTASVHLGDKHPVSEERVRSVAGHPSLGKRGYTTVPMERRHRELVAVAEWQRQCSSDPEGVAVAIESFRQFCGGGSMVPHIATCGPAAHEALQAMGAAPLNLPVMKDVAPYLRSRGLALPCHSRDGFALYQAAGLEVADSATSPIFAAYLALKLLDDMDASGWSVSFGTDIDRGGNRAGLKLRALL